MNTSTAAREKNPRVIHAANPSDQWFTPLHLRELAQRVLRRIDLDPATSAENPLQAVRWFTAADDALSRPWRTLLEAPGPDQDFTIWLNPPYGRGIGAWMQRVHDLTELMPSTRVLVLVPSRPGARWYASSSQHAQLLCELHGRVRFERPDGSPAPDEARWGCALMYWGPDRKRVAGILRAHGVLRWGRRLKPQPTTIGCSGQLRLLPLE